MKYTRIWRETMSFVTNSNFLLTIFDSFDWRASLLTYCVISYHFGCPLLNLQSTESFLHISTKITIIFWLCGLKINPIFLLQISHNFYFCFVYKKNASSDTQYCVQWLLQAGLRWKKNPSSTALKVAILSPKNYSK